MIEHSLFFSLQKILLTINNHLKSPTLSMIKYIINCYHHACRLQFRRLEFIFDLFLQTFLFIKITNTNNCPKICRIFPNAKGMCAFDFK